MADFLHSLDLPQHVPAFLDNAVDGALLLQLTTEDLMELGVVRRVHRVRAPRCRVALSQEHATPQPSATPRRLTRPVLRASQKKIRLRLGLPLEEDDGASSLAVRGPTCFERASAQNTGAAQPVCHPCHRHCWPCASCPCGCTLQSRCLTTRATAPVPRPPHPLPTRQSGSVIDAVERWRLTGKESGVGGSLRPGLRAPGGVMPASPGGTQGGDWLTSPGRERGTSHALFAGRAPASTLPEEDEDEMQAAVHRGEEDLSHDALEARRGSSPPPPQPSSSASAADIAQAEAKAAAVALRKATEAQRAAEEEARRENEARAERERAEQKRIIREARDKARAEALAATQVALDDAKRKAQEDAAQRAEAERKRQADAAFAALVEAQRRDNLAASAAAAVERENSELARRKAERAKQAEWEAQRERERQQKLREQDQELAAAAARRETDAAAARERREQLARLQTSGPGAADEALHALAAAKAKAAQTRGAFDTAFGADMQREEDAELRAAFGTKGPEGGGKPQPPAPLPAVRVKTPPASPPTLSSRSVGSPARQASNGERGSPAGVSRHARLGPPPSLSLDSAPTSPSKAQPDKYAVAAVGADTRLRLWMVPRLGLPPVTAPTSVKEGHTDEVKAICLLTDGCLVTGGRDAQLRVWPRGGGCATVPSPGGTVFAICALPTGGCVTACSDTTLRVWLPSGSAPGSLACRHQLGGHKNMVFALDVTPDGVRLVSGSADKTARLWRLDSLGADDAGMKSVRTLSGHTAWVNAVKLYDGATRCATGSADGNVRLWRCSSGECVATCAPQAARDPVAVLALDVLADTERIAAAYDDGRLCVWNQGDGSLHAAVEGAHNEAVRAITALPDGRLATGGDDRLIKLWREERDSLVCDGALTGDITSDSIFAITHC